MADLATTVELVQFIGHPDPGDYPELLEWAEGTLEDDLQVVFGAEAAVTDEPYNGTGRKWQYLRRPAKSGASITAKISWVGNVSDPDDTIPSADIKIDPENARRIIRVQNGVFPQGEYNLFFTYTAKGFVPLVAKRAVLAAAAFAFRRKDKGHISGETIGEFGGLSLFAPDIRRLPEWRHAIEGLRAYGVVG